MARDNDSVFLIEVVSRPAQLVLVLVGELDVATVPIVERTLREVRCSSTEPPSELILDLSRLGFADLRGLEALDAALGDERRRGGSGCVVGASEMVLRVARLARLDEIEAAVHLDRH